MKTKTKKFFVVDFGDVRDCEWENAAVLGLELLKKMRDAGFQPKTLAPYEIDGGDVSLLITVTLEKGQNKLKIDLLNSLCHPLIVDNKAYVNVLDQDEWDEMINGDDGDDD